MRHLLNLIAAILVLGSLMALTGCGEKPVDPVKANEGQGQSIDVPARRSEGLGQQQGS